MCKNTNMQDLGRNKENDFVGQGQNTFKIHIFFLFFPLILNLHYFFLIKMYKPTKWLFTYKPRAVCFFFLFFSYLPSLSSIVCHADFKIFWHLFSILLLILSAFCLIDGMLDAGPSLQELSWHLQRRLSPADVNSGMWQGIPFQKSSVMPEMLVAINTACIFYDEKLASAIL